MKEKILIFACAKHYGAISFIAQVFNDVAIIVLACLLALARL